MVTDEYLELVAVGLFALTVPVMSHDVDSTYRALPERDRDLFRAKARFVLSFADASALKAGR